MDKKTIIEKFSKIILGQASYKNNVQYKISELSNIDEAYLIMWEIWNHEGFLTKAGYNFIEEYYGLENFSEQLSNKGGFDESKDKKSILEWLVGIKNETIE